MAKKSNYIEYELKKLEVYLKQLQDYLDNNPPDKAQDRIEQLQSPRGIPIIKVISRQEDQIKLFITTLEKLPKLLFDLNTLRKEVKGIAPPDLRGGAEQPGFMGDEENIDEEEEQDQPISSKKSDIKTLPNSTTSVDNIDFDDDSYYDYDED